MRTAVSMSAVRTAVSMSAETDGGINVGGNRGRMRNLLITRNVMYGYLYATTTVGYGGTQMRTAVSTSAVTADECGRI